MYNIAEYLFRKKIFFNLLVILQLAICLSFTNYGYTMTNSFFKGYNETYKFGDAYIFYSSYSVAYKNIFDVQYGYSFKENGNTLEPCYYPIKQDNYTITMFGEKTLEIYSKNLIKGKLEKSQSDMINCLVVGDKSLYNKTIELTINGIDYKFYVTGILPEETLNITDLQINQYSTPDKVFVDFDSSVTNIICLDIDLPNMYNHNYNATALVYFGENKQEGINMISRYGTLVSMNELRNTGDTTQEYIVKRALSYVSYGAGIMGIISMLCMFILNIKNNEDMFRTFRQLGIKIKHIIQISSIYMLFFNTILVLITIPLIYFWKKLLASRINIVFGFNNYVFTILILIFTYILNIVCSYYILFKEGDRNE